MRMNRPTRNIHGGEKAIARHVHDTASERVFRREGDRVDDEIQFAPVLGDALEHRLHLSGHLTSSGIMIGAYSSRANGSTYFFALSFR